jgi:replicative DNA helicase
MSTKTANTITPPHDEGIEQAALGAMIGNDAGAMLARAEHGLSPEMFFVPAHQLIVRTLYQLADEPKWKGFIDPLILSNRLREAGVLEEVGGFEYLVRCSELSPVTELARNYFDQVRVYHERRRVIQVCREVVDQAYGDAQDGFVQGVPQRFYDILPQRTSRLTLAESLQEIRQEWRELQEGKKEMSGLPTGNAKIDGMLAGFQPGSYNIIAARPSAGKTTLAGDIVNFHCKRGTPVAWVNMDMPRRDLEKRILCREAGVSLPKLNAGHAGEKNFAQVERAIVEIGQWPLHMLHAVRDVSKICSWIRLMVMRHGVKLLVLDYVQKLTADHINSHDPVRLISYGSAAIKELCQELDLPVLVLAQLGRSDPKDRRPPTLESLKGCGDLEQDAQTAMLLYKYEKFDYENAIDPATRRPVNEVTDRAICLDVAKNQNGGIGVLEFWFRTSYFKFESAPEDWGFPGACK